MFRTNFTHDKELDNNLNMTTKNPGRITSIRSDDSDNLHDKLNCYLVHLAHTDKKPKDNITNPN